MRTAQGNPLALTPLLVPVALVALGASRPASSAAAPQEPALRAEVAADAMTLARPGEVGLRLSPALGSSWRHAGVERLSVRAAGRQVDLDRERLADAPTTLVPIADRGCSLVAAALYETSERQSGESVARAHHAKTVVCAGLGTDREALAHRRRAAPALMAKTGGRVEIQPLVSPSLLLPGSDLPVRALVRGAPYTSARLEAVGPGGAVRALPADSVGTATFRIDRPGAWLVRFRAREGEAVYSAELSFEVPRVDFRDAPPASGTITDATGAAARADAVADRWRALGPAPIASHDFTGRTAGIVTVPGKAGHYLVAAAGGGVWLTRNGGRRWRARTDDLPTLATGAIAIDPGNRRVIYAGSGEANYAYHSLYGLGLYKSTNGGRRWTQMAEDTFAGRTFARIAVSPADGDVVLAAVAHAGGTPDLEAAKGHPAGDGDVGIFRSPDGGASWTHVLAGLPNLPASDVAIDPADADRVYAAFGQVFGDRRNGVYRSTDGGVTFGRLRIPLPNRRMGRISLAIAPSSPDRLYALVTHAADDRDRGAFTPDEATTLAVLRSDDGGDSWTEFRPGNFQATYGHYVSTIAVHPESPDTVLIGGVTMLRSQDGGRSWDDITPPHVDLHGIAFDADGRMVVADDGGVHRSENLGRTWTAINGRLSSVQFYPGISVHPQQASTLLAGAQDNGTSLRVGGSWSLVLGGDGGYTAIAPDGTLFAEFQGTGNLFASIDGGFTFQRRANGIDAADRNCFLPPFVIDPNRPGRMLYGTHRVYESLNSGGTWRALSGDLTGGAPAAIRALVIAPSRSETVYAATNDGRVLVSADGGAGWSLVREDVGGWPRVMRQIAVDPDDDRRVYVAVARFGGDKVLESTDRGATWRAVDGDLPDSPVNTVAVHRAGGTLYLFAGTDSGVFGSDDGGVTWSRQGTGLPNAPVMDLVVDAANGRLLATTLGRGAWDVDLPR